MKLLLVQHIEIWPPGFNCQPGSVVQLYRRVLTAGDRAHIDRFMVAWSKFAGPADAERIWGPAFRGYTAMTHFIMEREPLKMPAPAVWGLSPSIDCDH